MNKTLLSFIGTNDAGKLIDQPDGAILNTLSLRKFDKIYLLWNDAKIKGINYSETIRYLKKEIRNRKLCKSVEDYEFEIKSVIDHNEIYQILISFTDQLEKNDTIEYTAAISSGTPAMQVCWILLAESGDFSEDYPLKLIQTTPPLKGKSKLINVKLNTALPQIKRLKKEVKELEESMIPQCIISTSTGQITIGETSVDISPMQFAYYVYFAERVINDDGPERISGYWLRKEFWERVLEIHKKAYPDADSQREKLEVALKDKGDLMITTFRGNISKMNKRISNQLENKKIAGKFIISSEGKRGAKFYSIKASPEKLSLL